MNIHINKNTRIQTWNRQTVFEEYPIYIRPGNFTVSLMFHDIASIKRLNDCLTEMIEEIEEYKRAHIFESALS